MTRLAPILLFRAAVVMLLAVAQPGSRAQAPALSPPPTLQAVHQKAGMVDRVLNHSTLAARVQEGQSETARQHIANARELLALAGPMANSGQTSSADQLLNAALWEIGRARQLVPQANAQEAGERARVQREDRAMREAAARLAGQTLVYDRRFATARQEFDYELERHRSFERLVPVAVERFHPGADVRARIDVFLEKARLLREKGEAAAVADIPSAIRLVLEGTDALHGALQAAGLVVPTGAEK